MKEITKQVKEFELIAHGWMARPQRFPGHGVSLARHANIATGSGANPVEAINDCLDQVAADGFDDGDLEERIMDGEEWEALPTAPDRRSGLRYYLSIRWN